MKIITLVRQVLGFMKNSIQNQFKEKDRCSSEMIHRHARAQNMQKDSVYRMHEIQYNKISDNLTA